MTEHIKKVMTEEGWNAFVAAVAWKGSRLIIPREQAAIVTALSPLDFQKWLAESITSYQPGVKTSEAMRPFSFKLGSHSYEFTVRKDGRNVEELQEWMKALSFHVRDHVKNILDMGELIIGPTENVIFRVYRAGVLGVAGCVLTEFFGPQGWSHLRGLGLSKCLPDDAFYIRRNHDEQKRGEGIMIAHDPICSPFSTGNNPIVFYVANSRDERYITGYGIGSSNNTLNVDDLLAVRVISK